MMSHRTGRLGRGGGGCFHSEIKGSGYRGGHQMIVLQLLTYTFFILGLVNSGQLYGVKQGNISILQHLISEAANILDGEGKITNWTSRNHTDEEEGEKDSGK